METFTTVQVVLSQGPTPRDRFHATVVHACLDSANSTGHAITMCLQPGVFTLVTRRNVT